MVPLRQTRKGFGIRHAHAVQDFPLVVATVDIAFRTEIWMIQPNAWKHDHGGGWTRAASIGWAASLIPLDNRTSFDIPTTRQLGEA